MLNIRKTYTLTYDTNGGNADGPSAQTGLLPGAYPLSTTKPTHAPIDGKPVVWIGWTAEQDTAIYARGSESFDLSHVVTTITISDKNETVYALWGYDENGNGTADVLEETAIVTFRISNGTWADGTNADKQVIVPLTDGKGTLDAADIPTGMKADSGYTGGTWDRQPDTTADAMTGNVLYTYSFHRDGGHGGNGGHGGSTRYTLTYVSNGGTEYKAERYSSGTTVKLSKTPVREGYHFTGWYADKNLTDKIDRIQMTKNKTVYAGWEKNASELHIPDMLNGDDHFAYVAGYTDGTVRPNAKITRAEVAMIFYRLLDEDVRAANETDTAMLSSIQPNRHIPCENFIVQRCPVRVFFVQHSRYAPLGAAMFLPPAVIAVCGEVGTDPQPVAEQKNEDSFQTVLTPYHAKRMLQRRPAILHQPHQSAVHIGGQQQGQPDNGDDATGVKGKMGFGKLILPHGQTSVFPVLWARL